MPTYSKDEKVKNAIKHINTMEAAAAINEYIAGEERQDVLDAARLQIELIEKTAPPAADQLKPGDALPGEKNAVAAAAAAAGNSIPAAPGPESKDTTKTWVKTLSNLQPAPGDVPPVLASAPKPPKPAVRKILTIVNGAPHWVHFDEDGTKVKTEKVPGH